MLASPLVVPVWPTFVFTDPTSKGSVRDLCSRKTEAIALASIGSPVRVPVPWASKYAVCAGSSPAFS
jgi:hypothetical protein